MKNYRLLLTSSLMTVVNSVFLIASSLHHSRLEGMFWPMDGTALVMGAASLILALRLCCVASGRRRRVRRYREFRDGQQ